MSHATIAFGAIEDARGSISFESGTDVHAADGLLVVLVRGLGDDFSGPS
jgi:hypothetical protein